MSVLRFTSLAIVALWIGGLATLGLVAAPAVFDTMETFDPVGGRTVAGLVFGNVVQRFQHLAWGLGGALLVLLAVRMVLGPRPRHLARQMLLVMGMLAASVYTGAVVAPRIDALRGASTATMASRPATDPGRIEFGRLHAFSNGLMALTLAAGLALFWIEGKD